MRLLACGDIHGHKSKLVNSLMKASLIDENEDWIASDTRLVFLGDYTDRGPDVFGVVELLLKLKVQAESFNSELIFLKGNHEDMMFESVDDESSYLWVCNGGGETLTSYGLYNGWVSEAPKSVEKILEKHGNFYKNLLPYYSANDTLFVHAGVDPYGTAATILKSKDYMWIRHSFFKQASSEFLRNYGVERVVFGHTIHADVTPYLNGALLAVDTGSFIASGRVSIVELLPNLQYNVLA